MTEEIQEVERLIRQSGELADSLIRLAQKLREQHQCFLNTVQQPGLQDVTLFQFEPDECGKNQLVADYTAAISAHFHVGTSPTTVH